MQESPCLQLEIAAPWIEYEHSGLSKALLAQSKACPDLTRVGSLTPLMKRLRDVYIIAATVRLSSEWIRRLKKNGKRKTVGESRRCRILYGSDMLFSTDSEGAI